ncbi:MAG TPA: hypothetical protein VMV10_21290 [Pirellulales bacterium]|nr:hypothetical protein [Pirellulales bacterium]
MNHPSDDPRRPLRQSVYLLLTVIGIGGITGRVLAVNAVDTIRLESYLKGQGRKDWQKQRPFLSGNDRSRWCTVRALVEHGTYAIDEIVNQPNWDTIDMVKHDEFGAAAPGPDEGHLYSSKPPLLATLMAGEYWLIHKFTGATLGEHPYTIGRAIIITFNVLPLIVYFLLVAKLVERFGATDWGRMFVFGAAAFGTFLGTFAVVINNHLTAAVSAAISLHAALLIWYGDAPKSPSKTRMDLQPQGGVYIVHGGDRRLRWFALAGFFAAFTAANELPALAFFAAMTVGLLWKAPRGTMLAYLPAALLVAAASVGTNYLAHHSVLPAYAHRGKTNALAQRLDPHAGDNWYDYQYRRGEKRIIDSYWSKLETRSPIDQGEPDRAVYAFHVLIGHHGIFSLTPIWLLSVLGVGILCFRREPHWIALGVLIGSVSAVCIAFYLLRPLEDRNYGGMNSGFRWVFWFAPLWLVAMLPAADAAATHRWSRGLACLLLAFSVLSVTYPAWNPWVHPWILDFLLSQDAVKLGMR